MESGEIIRQLIDANLLQSFQLIACRICHQTYHVSDLDYDEVLDEYLCPVCGDLCDLALLAEVYN